MLTSDSTFHCSLSASYRSGGDLVPVQRWASLNSATLEVRTPKRLLIFIPIQMLIVAFIGTGGAGWLLGEAQVSRSVLLHPKGFG